MDKIENADIEKIENTFIAPGNEANKNAAIFFGTLLGIPVGTLPADLPTEKIADITIVAGKNYRFTRLQDLLP